MHVTVRIADGLPGLRRKDEYRALRRAFAAGCSRFGFRLLHYSVQRDHLHLIVEAADRVSLSRGMQGLLIRVARALNRLWERKGAVFADRYHDHVLRTPREVRRALAYVLHNARKHGLRYRARGVRDVAIDPYASGWWFDGWRRGDPELRAAADGAGPPVTRARTWLLSTGWRRHGLLRVDEMPGGRPGGVALA